MGRVLLLLVVVVLVVLLLQQARQPGLPIQNVQATNAAFPAAMRLALPDALAASSRYNPETGVFTVYVDYQGTVSAATARAALDAARTLVPNALAVVRGLGADGQRVLVVWEYDGTSWNTTWR